MARDILKELVNRKGLTGKNNQIWLFDSLRYTMYPAQAFAVTIKRLKDDKGENYLIKLAKVVAEGSLIPLLKELNKRKGLINKDFFEIASIIELSGFGKISEFSENKNQFLIRFDNHPVLINHYELYKKEKSSLLFYSEIYKYYIETIKNLKLNCVEMSLKKGRATFVFKNGN